MSLQYLNWNWVLLALPLAGGPVQSRDAQPLVNLGQLESTYVTVSSVNGGRKQDNPYYGGGNLFDGGRNSINGMRYTTWLSNWDASHWVEIEFRDPVEIHSIMLELPALSRPLGSLPVCDPTTNERDYRPQEVALDVGYRDRVEKLPSILIGFRTYYPLNKPLEAVVRLTLVFPGRSTIEVSEVEILGRVPAPTADALPGSSETSRVAPSVLLANFALTLIREGVFSDMPNSQLEVTVFQGNGTASLSYQRTDGSRISGRAELTQDETARLVRLVREADLYGANHIGSEPKLQDVGFETLRLRDVEGGRMVVLVTTGNKAFDEDAIRHELIEVLRTVERRVGVATGLDK